MTKLFLFFYLLTCGTSLSFMAKISKTSASELKIKSIVKYKIDGQKNQLINSSIRSSKEETIISNDKLKIIISHKILEKNIVDFNGEIYLKDGEADAFFNYFRVLTPLGTKAILKSSFIDENSFIEIGLTPEKI